ncbi:MAG: hypothetical protein CW346_01585 [Bacillaceae bacterium]|nr:hypothetical protein [Bacillaceae bacterium]
MFVCLRSGLAGARFREGNRGAGPPAFSLSFFTGTNEHVVLKEKELSVKRLTIIFCLPEIT